MKNISIITAINEVYSNAAEQNLNLQAKENTCNLNLDKKVRKPNNNGSFKVII
jgi:hypothetical protein